MPLLKRCSKCREFKSLEYFHNDKNRKDGKCFQCKECKLEYWKEYYKEHTEKKIEYERKYRKEHKVEINKYDRKYNQEHKEEKGQWQKTRRVTDPSFRLNAIMSSAISRIKNPSIKQGRSWKNLVPYTLTQLKKHLKRSLPKGYTWKDFMQGKLHIDHIHPLAIFQYEKPEDLGFQICWGLDNLRLLPAKENMRKHAKLTIPFQKTFAMEINLRR